MALNPISGDVTGGANGNGVQPWVSTTHPSAARPAPIRTTGVIGWMRANLFSGFFNTLLTILTAVVLYLIVVGLARWVFFEAYWEPVWVNRKLFTVGLYPWERIWQVVGVLWVVSALMGISAGEWGSFMRTLGVGLASLLFALALLPLDPTARIALFVGAGLAVGGYLLGRFAQFKTSLLVWAWVLSLPLSVWLLRGGITLPFVGTIWTFGGDLIPYSVIGGLVLTMLLAVVGITLSFPIGVLLALGRRSKLPIVKGVCVGYIELIRGVPLVTLLFMAMIALPLILPSGATAPENAVRAMVAITLFAAAYLAENVRGGLQAVPKGQYEAADAVGLSGIQKLRLIVLPQALRAVIPAIVGQFIGLFKDTSLVSLVGLLELLGIARVVIQQAEWVQVQGGITREVYVFVAVVYFLFSYGMSYASRRLEVQLDVGQR
jgi:general L-amino acid transport system permease protein